MRRKKGASESCAAFSRNDHSSTPHVKPANRRATFSCRKSSTQVSSSHAMAMAVRTRAAFATVRHALRLSKYHARSARRAAARSAATPERKSMTMKSSVVAMSGPAGAKSPAMPAAAPLTYLYKVSIGRAAVEDVAIGVVFGNRVPVVGQVAGRATQQRPGLGEQAAPHPEKVHRGQTAETETAVRVAEEYKDRVAHVLHQQLAGDCGGTRAEAGQEERTERIRKALGRTYRFAAETGLPPKVSVSELKRAQADYDDDAMEGEGLDPEREVLPLGRSGGGTAYGNAFHRMMQLLSFADLPEGTEVGAYLTSEKERIRSQGLMSGEELYLISDEELKAFLLSDTAKAMAAAARRGELWREQRFMATFPADELMPEAGSHEPQLLQGIVDAFYADEAGELSIVDYKTDRLFDREAFIERYGLQLELYRRALQKLTGRRVRSTVIYSTAMGCTILCTHEEET